MRHFIRTAAVVSVLVAGIAPAARADVAYPFGTQNFESMSVGQDINTVPDWFTVNQPGTSPFTVVAANDVLGGQTTRAGSTRWLRVTDQDSGNVQNRFYSTVVVSPSVENYSWVFYVNPETVMPGGASVKPKLTIQHDNAPFANAWGIEFTDAGPNLVVLGIGGAAAAVPLDTPGMPIGLWAKISLHVDFDANQVSASVDNGPAVSLPISLAPTADKKTFRFCFRGEGTGNASTMLLDDVSVFVHQPTTNAAPALGGVGLAAMFSAFIVALGVRHRRPTA